MTNRNRSTKPCSSRWKSVASSICRVVPTHNRKLSLNSNSYLLLLQKPLEVERLFRLRFSMSNSLVYRRIHNRCARLLRGIGVELLVVIVSNRDVATPADDANGMSNDMSLCIGGQPELVIDELLIEREGAAFSHG